MLGCNTLAYCTLVFFIDW